MKGSITCVYEYQPVSVFDQADALQRFGYVKIEATSFTISEPHESLSIEPIIFSAASISEREILSKQYDVKPFGIKTIKLERIFVDKILAAEFYYQRNRLFDVSKHLYDLAIMLKQERIMLLLENHIFLNEMLNYKRKEEKYRMGSDLAKKPLSDFILYAQLKNDQALKDNFEHMQSIYVFSKKDLLKLSIMVYTFCTRISYIAYQCQSCIGSNNLNALPLAHDGLVCSSNPTHRILVLSRAAMPLA